MPGHLFITALAYALVLTLVPIKIYASCCSLASSGGRLLAHERGLLELGSKTSYLLGSFNGQGKFSAGHIAHLPHLTLEQELQVMVRMLDFFQPFIRLPTRIQKSSQRVGANFADMSLGARLPICQEDFIDGWPQITLFNTLKLPTGMAFKADREIDNESITSNGEWLITLGLHLEKEVRGITYGLGYSFSAEPYYFKNRSLCPPPIHAPLLSLGYDTTTHGSFNVFLMPTFQGVSIRTAGSGQKKLTLGMGYALALHSHIRINAQMGCDLPIAYLGKNFNSEFFVRLGMRLGIF